MLQAKNVQKEMDTGRIADEGIVGMEQPLGCGYASGVTPGNAATHVQGCIYPTRRKPEETQHCEAGPAKCWVSLQIPAPPMSFTTYAATRPINKYIFYNRKDGTIHKESRASDAYKCKFMATHTVAADVLHAAQILDELDECDCISIATFVGYAPGERVKIVSRQSFERAPEEEWSYRSKETMEFRDRQATLFPIDYDDSKCSADEVVRRIRKIMPEFGNVPIIVSPSSSSYIYCRYEEREIVGSKGMHLFIPISNAADVCSWGELLKYRAWASGYGKIQLSVDGKQLVRDSLEDNCIYTPDRLLYSKPLLGPGLTRSSPGVQVYPGALPMVMEKPPKPSAALKRKVRRLQELEMRRTAAEAKRIRAEYLEDKVAEQLERLPRKERSAENEKKIRNEVESMLSGGPLAPGHILIHRSGREVKVADILKDPFAYAGQQFADPMEPQAYGFDKRIATLYVAQNGRKITMYSFAHGGRTFTLREYSPQRVSVPIQSGEIYDTIKFTLSELGKSLAFYRRGNASNPQIVKLLKDRGQFYVPSRDQLNVELNRMFEFLKYNKKGEAYAVDCPDNLVKHVQAATEEISDSLRPLKAVVDHPIVTAQGKLVARPGYDSHTRLYLDLFDCYPDCKV